MRPFQFFPARALLTALCTLSACRTAPLNKHEAADWYTRYASMVRWVGYQGSDQQFHHFIARVMDDWNFIKIERSELTVVDERPFSRASSAPLYYYLVDPSRDYRKVEDKSRGELDGPANRSQAIRSETDSASPSAAEKAEGMACTFCGGRFAWVGRSDAHDVFECQDCGEQVPHQPMITVRKMPDIPLGGTMTDTEARELRAKALQLRPEMSADQIEATMGLARFATCSSIATNGSGRIELNYATEPDVLIVLTGEHRHVAPRIYVVVDRWRARFETNGWRVVE